MANLAILSDQDLLSEAALAADLTREAPNPSAEAEAFELLMQLLNEVDRREELHATVCDAARASKVLSSAQLPAFPQA
jgi:hypothetical protein